MNLIGLGAQWGDEGKGKIIDYLSENADIVVRYQGGNNAGHTVVVGENKYFLHIVPSGILHGNKICVIGNGVLIDPECLLSELDYLKENGIDYEGRLIISECSHVIMPYHRLLDKLNEEKSGSGKIGTTNRGIGPAYTDKVGRLGIRMVDLKNENILRYKIDKNLEIKNFIIKKYYGGKVFSSKTILKEYLDYGKKLNRFIKNTFEYINGPKRKNILFEGAQGTLLDIDFGTYPFVTGSNAAAGGVCTGTGISPVKIGKIIGVTKAYTTRVGAGSFPTELPEKENKALREKGGEFGVTTGRPRRCGWFDSVMIRYSSMINGFHSMAVTKLDILSGIKEIKLCTGYRYKNSTIKEFPADMQVLSSCKPIYKTMKGWDDDIAKSCTYKELPGNAKKYLDEIKRLTKTDISIVSVGPGREQTILLDKDLWKK